MRNKTLSCITEGAVMVAAALVLNLLRAPTDWLSGTGGSVELTMIPLVVFALRHGWGWGIGAGAVFGTLKCIVGGGIAYGWAALLLDYTAAFAVVGLAGLLPKKPVWGAALGAFARYAVHVLSGVIIWGEWMPDEFLGLAMTSVWIYSAIYNAIYMAVNAVLLCVVIAVLSKKTGLLSVDNLPPLRVDEETTLHIDSED